jgi:hypothetical protein
MKKEEGLGRRQATKCGAKRQARTCPRDHATTPAWPNEESKYNPRSTLIDFPFS